MRINWVVVIGKNKLLGERIYLNFELALIPGGNDQK
jgi:hypothetical protein